MKSFFLKIKKILRNINNFFNINPHKHWAFLLYFFSILSLLLIIFSLFILYEIKNEQIFQVKIETKSNGNVLKETSLKRIISNFEEKAIKEQRIIENPPVYKDPSI